MDIRVLSFVAVLAQGLAALPATIETNAVLHPRAQNSMAELPSTSAAQGASEDGTWPWQVFQTEPFNPPVFDIQADGQPLAPGAIFMTPADINSNQTATKQAGPLIMDSQGKAPTAARHLKRLSNAKSELGQLVWNGPLSKSSSMFSYIDFRVQQLNGTSYLTYWSGYETSSANIGHGFGSTTFLDESYEEVFVVCPHLGLKKTSTDQGSCDGDIHEQQVTPQGTLLITAYNVTTGDLTSVNGSANGTVLDSMVFELDIKTSEVLWHWSSLEHVPIDRTHAFLREGQGSPESPFDYFHVNSIDMAGDNVLINGRHTWETYLVNKPSGEIIWTLNGETGGDFGALPANFVSGDTFT